ncbi:TIGR01244 family phosphatase [Nitrincola tibetensis]|uniref:TIGR01244 family phosphatase n=1 Tax=Nitrincola tibetensis TaxID=2219697 RepID=A0A364NMH3_9GAMM|nr:TIGR01244 family sulfur transferase [Nitrincola tibetensis]RAU18262.1 TIGR01244 family phosphatase [Nitrincola tibetensis]
MDIKELEPGFSICHAIQVSDVGRIKALGFKSVICNRVPGEADDYQHDSSLRQAIEAEGLYWQDIPVVPGEYTEEAIEAFGYAIEALPTPILAFCRTGRRAVSLWVHSQVKLQDCDLGALLNAAHAAGHDIQDSRPALEKRMANKP